MNIIKKGQIEIKEIITTCYKCGTVFSYTETDMKPDRDGAYVVCPLEGCSAFIAAENPYKKAMNEKLRADIDEEMKNY